MAAIEKSNVCVLVPAFNEAKRIAGVTTKIKAQGFSVLVVDDGSQDATAEVAEAAGARVVRADKNRGKGASLRRGFEWVVAQGFSAVITMDGDGQHDPKELQRFLNALNQGRAAVIVGNRMTDTKNMPFVRKMTNRIMSWMVSTVAGQRVPDSQCGYRAIKKEVLEKMRLYTSHYEIESEILLEAARCGFAIESVPVGSVYGNEGSHIRPLRDTLRFFRFLLEYLSHA